MSYEAYTGEGLQRHIERCPACAYLDAHGHPELCAECDHPWHVGLCGPSYCPCEECSDAMTPEQVADEINAHARDEDEAAYDKAMDAKLSEWKERER